MPPLPFLPPAVPPAASLLAASSSSSCVRQHVLRSHLHGHCEVGSSRCGRRFAGCAGQSWRGGQPLPCLLAQRAWHNMYADTTRAEPPCIKDQGTPTARAACSLARLMMSCAHTRWHTSSGLSRHLSVCAGWKAGARMCVGRLSQGTGVGSGRVRAVRMGAGPPLLCSRGLGCARAPHAALDQFLNQLQASRHAGTRTRTLTSAGS